MRDKYFEQLETKETYRKCIIITRFLAKNAIFPFK